MTEEDFVAQDLLSQFGNEEVPLEADEESARGVAFSLQIKYPSNMIHDTYIIHGYKMVF